MYSFFSAAIASDLNSSICAGFDKIPDAWQCVILVEWAKPTDAGFLYTEKGSEAAGVSLVSGT